MDPLIALVVWPISNFVNYAIHYWFMCKLVPQDKRPRFAVAFLWVLLGSTLLSGFNVLQLPYLNPYIFLLISIGLAFTIKMSNPLRIFIGSLLAVSSATSEALAMPAISLVLSAKPVALVASVPAMTAMMLLRLCLVWLSVLAILKIPAFYSTIVALNWRECFYFCLILLVSFVTNLLAIQMGLVFPEDVLGLMFAIVIFAAIFIVNILLVLLHTYLLERNRLEGEMDLFTQMQRDQTLHYTSLAQEMKEMGHFQHDVRRNLQLVHQLITEEKLNDASGLADEMDARIRHWQKQQYSHTQNPTLNAILHTKTGECREKEIALRIDFGYSNFSWIEPYETASIFGNLLDNAIDAAASMPAPQKREIALSSKRHNSILVLEITNTRASSALPKKEGRFLSTKSGPGRHGLGLEIVERTVEAMNGTLDFENTDSLFCVRVFLTLPRDVL